MTDRSAIQLIDEEKEFHQSALQYFQQCIGNRDVGLDYHVISVFGSQSSGKSTLLNVLFNTNFDTMDAQVKRQQTTKGIWLAHTKQVNTTIEIDNDRPDIFVLDVEGSDGSERGEDQDFERKAALFAIAVSEVLIVNMWEQQIGLYQGNNMALLKTVFEVNLSLFGKNDNDHKVLLLFVIRDHVGVTPLSSLSDSVTRELEKIWTELSKPAGCEGSSLYDYFDLKFVGLAHKLLQEDKFTQDVKKLGDSFVMKGTENYYFKPQYHHRLPLDGWTMYAENCWDQIERNKDLDLPTQQILVARFKTEEISNEALEEFISKYDESIAPLKGNLGSLTSQLVKLKEECLTKYDEQASRYARNVYMEKREALNTKLNSHISGTINEFLESLMEKLWDDLKLEVSSRDKATTSFVESVAAGKSKIEKEFNESMETFKKLGLLISNEEITCKFSDDIEERIKQLRDAELKAKIGRIRKNLVPELKDHVIHLLSHPSKKVWDDIMNDFESTIKDNISAYQVEKDKYDFKIGLSESENAKIYKNIRILAWRTLDTTVHDYLKIDTIVSILRDRFEDVFRYDAEGSPRLWKTEEEIDGAFRVAKEHALEVFEVLSLAVTSDNVEIIPDVPMAEEESGEDNEIYRDNEGVFHSRRFAHILTELQKENVLDQFRRQINITVLDSKRSIITIRTHIPPWIYVLLAVLGWNEFVAVIRNPLFVTLTLILGATFFVIHKFGLWGPVVNVIQSAVGETRTAIKDKLRQFVVEDHEVKESFEMKDFSKNEQKEK
ncbi:AFH_G0051040.mRNA.1.CDS.1 [Saccharomyces cerevisiae]|nr:Sey1p [Saccharomyces cerevisiae YJM682]AJT90229.1 Sey1p [Saccharomyces cerevisiae YJM1208]AJU01882.1 Sey1p [Saccharomyces cerevisiae YJM1389]AJU13118.1 Sey1p [Saccharomyces cerevisiae YJM1549]AJU14599.1 Sey1p [Saccharomyces cerevisiae YJM1592]CAI4813546.1 CEL_1a_G0050710.mRNA.1.CDS.1 [Saccharomyces cerevisiae]